MATQAENSGTLDLDSVRDRRLYEAFIGLIEIGDDPDAVVRGWFDTAAIQLAFYQRAGIEATPEEIRRMLRHFASGLLVDTYDRVDDRWALFDPGGVRSLLRLALAQSDTGGLTDPEMDWLSRRFAQVVEGHETRRPTFGYEEQDVVESLIRKGLLERSAPNLPGGEVQWAGRLGEWCSMGGSGEPFFEDLPRSNGQYIPDADWGWRHGGVMYLSDSKLELQEKIRSVWTSFRRSGEMPTPNRAEFGSVLALALDFEVELVPSETAESL
jgi:hypothetical protein